MKNALQSTVGIAMMGLMAGCTSGWSGTSAMATPIAAAAAPVAYRVVETATGASVPMSALVSRAAAADVVFFGEQHDDPETHFVEFAILEAIGRQRADVVLSLEMFERDVQPGLDNYLSGRASEAAFLAQARPWDRYATDYRAMVMLARTRGWKVLAANIPRSMASAIARGGLSVLDTITVPSRRFAAASLSCTNDAYRDRFAKEMTSHSAGGGPPTASDAAAATAMTQRFYEAQCAKDETMAEAIAGEARNGRVVIHYNGAFHSDYAQGTVQRVRRRVPEARMLVITAVPVDDPMSAALGEERPKADYVIFTQAPPKKAGS